MSAMSPVQGWGWGQYGQDCYRAGKGKSEGQSSREPLPLQSAGRRIHTLQLAYINKV